MEGKNNTFKNIIGRIPADSKEIKLDLIDNLNLNKDLINNYYSGRTKTIPHKTCIAIHLYLCRKYNAILGDKPILLEEWIAPVYDLNKNSDSSLPKFVNFNSIGI